MRGASMRAAPGGPERIRRNADRAGNCIARLPAPCVRAGQTVRRSMRAHRGRTRRPLACADRRERLSGRIRAYRGRTARFWRPARAKMRFPVNVRRERRTDSAREAGRMRGVIRFRRVRRIRRGVPCLYFQGVSFRRARLYLFAGHYLL